MKSLNIIEFSEGLQVRMKQELEALSSDQDELIKIGKTLTFTRELISELNAFVRSYKFLSQAEEIQFFKEVKPVILSQYFYHKKIFAIRLVDSFKDAKSKQAYYYTILQRLEKYVKKNLEFYEYRLSGDTSLDGHYFTRNNTSNRSLDRDDNFSTGYDTKLAKILSTELIKNHVLNLLNGGARKRTSELSLTWTGQKTDLTELIYALHSAEVFNNGSANIKLIATAFEDLFNISLGDYYRIFQEIRSRKKSQTPFLDQLRVKFAQRLNELYR